jgi:septum formation protein
LAFEVVAPGVDEAPLPGERPAETAVRLAEAKARAVAPAHPDALIIGSDQVADFHGDPIGKPRDRADALEQLRAMRGRTIVFHTAVALLNARTAVAATRWSTSRRRFAVPTMPRWKPISTASSLSIVPDR